MFGEIDIFTLGNYCLCQSQSVRSADQGAGGGWGADPLAVGTAAVLSRLLQLRLRFKQDQEKY